MAFFSPLIFWGKKIKAKNQSIGSGSMKFSELNVKIG